MKSSKTFWLGASFERLFAFVILVAALPSLLLISFVIYAIAGKPVILCDEFPDGDGGITRRLRFRTTGRGTPFFRTVGRLLRKSSIDEVPALWSVVRGEIRLAEISNNFAGRVSAP